MKRFKAIDTTGDAGIRAFGNDLYDLFENTANGMYSLITDPEGVTPSRSIAIEIKADSVEGLLIAWLNELIFHFDAYGFIGKEIHIHELSGTLIKATVKGEDFDSEKHCSGLLIKAATYHKLKIEMQGDHWEAEVIFDI